jgi:hypothetical protein
LAIGGPVNYLQTPEVKLQKATQQAAFLWWSYVPLNYDKLIAPSLSSPSHIAHALADQIFPSTKIVHIRSTFHAWQILFIILSNQKWMPGSQLHEAQLPTSGMRGLKSISSCVKLSTFTSPAFLSQPSCLYHEPFFYDFFPVFCSQRRWSCFCDDVCSSIFPLQFITAMKALQLTCKSTNMTGR